MADRNAGRTEANVQSDLHMLLVTAPLNLGDGDLDTIVLESPAGQRRRIDVELGHTVFEVKRDLRVGNVHAEAVDQLGGYVRGRIETRGTRYVGVLTDGADWHLYHLAPDSRLQLVSTLTVDTTTPDVDGLVIWLEGVLATSQRIAPNPVEIKRRLGAGSPAHELDAVELAALYARSRQLPTVALKRELWAKLLTTALGTSFTDDDALFVEHTLLVITAEIISHAVVGFNPADPSITAATITSGRLFAQAQIGGVVESDFFDWVTEVPGGDRIVKDLARRLSRFAWDQVEHDVMKVLYESVISAETRHRLGEYYTPDWLADQIVSACVDDPLGQRVLDASCGSGTFLFHAIRHYLNSAQAAGVGNAEAIQGVTSKVIGVDVHPVAVTLARVTYLLAIGLTRLQSEDRPPFSVPVYLGDSLQWGQRSDLLTHDGLTVSTGEGDQLFADQLLFPDSLLADAGRFDRLVAILADKAANRPSGSAVPSITATLRLFAVHTDDRPAVEQTFRTLCQLHDQGRDHIWGYYVRNLARPVWLARKDNRVDVLVGNPPWLAYRYMTAAMQTGFRLMSEDRHLWAGASVATNQDLSGLFVARCVELYLREGGRFGYVMPWGALSRRQYAGFRAADYTTPTEFVRVAFDQPWDLHKVKPTFFPVPACVVFGRRATQPTALTQPAEGWAGRLPAGDPPSATAMQHLHRAQHDTASSASSAVSPYAARFSQGATVVPRVLFVVEDDRSSPFGAGAGRRAVRSARSSQEKPPWKNLPDLTGVVERQFVHSLYVGDTVLPFRIRTPAMAVVPWDGKRLLDGTYEGLDLYPGLAEWWRAAERLWNENRSSDRLTLVEQLDFRRKLTLQFPAAPYRIVYSASGMYLAAAIVPDPIAIIEHALYWASASNLGEARYLTAILNSNALTTAVRPLQARGAFGPRHYDKYVWQVPIPIFDLANASHMGLVALAKRAEQVAAGVELPNMRFEALRRRIREALVDDGVAAAIDKTVGQLLASTGR
jgi:SAM-dependent methyltransferase